MRNKCETYLRNDGVVPRTARLFFFQESVVVLDGMSGEGEEMLK